MKDYLAKTFLKWALYFGAEAYVLPDEDIMKEAFLQTTYVGEMYKDISGEAKRHMVYAKMIKKYPYVSKRELAFAIEATLRVRT
jgi:hypothetical protein